jgi:uncharacterized protein YcbX
MAVEVGRVEALWRYPVKSMQGEMLERTEVAGRGFVGDRLYAVRDADGKFGSGKSTRRFRRMDGLLDFSARSDGEMPKIRFPDGVERRGDAPDLDAALSHALGQSVTLAREAATSHFDAAPVHVVTTASLAWLRQRLPQSRIDPRRFRPNIVLENAGAALDEQAWIGRAMRVGGVVLRLVAPTERCVMVTMAQSELGTDPGILRQLAETNEACFGVYAEVTVSGVVALGDAASLD